MDLNHILPLRLTPYTTGDLCVRLLHMGLLHSAAPDLLKVFLIFAHTYLLESTNFSWPLMESWAEESH